MLIHGGGFCLGTVEQVEDDYRKWVRSYCGSTVSIEHRLAPKVKFPVLV